MKKKLMYIFVEKGEMNYLMILSDPIWVLSVDVQ